jgi:Rps23 Pro-64 3,4-dihydroxylase Tpa1-like proline 4-hydroxylase
MSWHADEVLYTGAFSYFVHPEWDAEFGGEFLVYDGAIRKKAGAGWKNREYDPLSVAILQDAGHTGGRFIEPLPNRMIVIRRGIMHKVAKVSRLAGSHVRASVTGFFLDAAVAPQVMGA